MIYYHCARCDRLCGGSQDEIIEAPSFGRVCVACANELLGNSSHGDCAIIGFDEMRESAIKVQVELERIGEHHKNQMILMDRMVRTIVALRDALIEYAEEDDAAQLESGGVRTDPMDQIKPMVDEANEILSRFSTDDGEKPTIKTLGMEYNDTTQN